MRASTILGSLTLEQHRADLARSGLRSSRLDPQWPSEPQTAVLAKPPFCDKVRSTQTAVLAKPPFGHGRPRHLLPLSSDDYQR